MVGTEYMGPDLCNLTAGGLLRWQDVWYHILPSHYYVLTTLLFFSAYGVGFFGVSPPLLSYMLLTSMSLST